MSTGKRIMETQSFSSFFQTNSNTKDEIQSLMKSGSLKRPNAAVGQSGLQALYETMFRNYGIMVGQVLVTKPDFYYEQTRQQLFATINELMQLNIIPIINTNDAVSPPPQQVLLQCTNFRGYRAQPNFWFNENKCLFKKRTIKVCISSF